MDEPSTPDSSAPGPLAADDVPRPTSAEAPASRPPASASPAGSDDDDWDDADSILSWKLLVAIALVLGVVGLGATVVLSGRKSSSGTSATAGPGDPPAGGGNTQTPAVRDSFERPDNSAGLGKTSTGEDWEAVAGTWGISANTAYLAAVNDKGPRNVAVVGIGGGNGSVQAKATKLTDGWGLVFRHRGPQAYWYIQWSDTAKTFNVFKVIEGKPEKPQGLDNVGLVKLDAEPPTIKIEFVGASITVFVNGKPQRTFSDSYLQNQGVNVGLYGEGRKVVDARWGDFVALKGLTSPSVTAPPRSTTSGTAKPKATTSTAPDADATPPGSGAGDPAGTGGAGTP